MTTMIDQQMLWLACGVLGVLTFATGTGMVLQQTVTGATAQATVANLNARVKAWWLLCGFFALALIDQQLRLDD